MKPSAILAKALSGRDSYELGCIARTLDIPAPQVRRAAKGAPGQPTRAEYYLKLCAWIGIEPVTGGAAPKEQLITLQADTFAMAVKMVRFQKRHSTSKAAGQMKISKAVLNRIEHADIRSFDCMLAAARYGNLDLHNYIAVAREAATGNPLTPNDNRSAA